MTDYTLVPYLDPITLSILRKVKFPLEQAMKARRVIEVIALLFL
jgi:hypothetical protein